MIFKKGIKLLSLSVLFLGLSSLMQADKGFITVDGKNIEFDVERQYQLNMLKDNYELWQFLLFFPMRVRYVHIYINFLSFFSWYPPDLESLKWH